MNGVLVASLYAPNGNPQPGPKFDYKLAWLDASCRACRAALPLRACPWCWPATSTSCRPTATSIRPSPRQRTRSCSRKAAPHSAASVDQGWVDAIRTLHPDAPMYTFWDYMRNRWPRDAGLRLDLLLLSAQAAEAPGRRRRRSRCPRRGRCQRPCAGLDRAARRFQVAVEFRAAHKPTGKAKRRPEARRREQQGDSCAPALAGHRRRLLRASLLSRAAENHPPARRQRRRRHPRLRQFPAAALPGRTAARRARGLGHA